MMSSASAPSRKAQGRYSIRAMPWGTIELEPEVEDWLLSLTDDDFGQVERYIDLLADEGVPSGSPSLVS